MGHDHGHDHQHGVSSDAQRAPLVAALVLLLLFMLGEVVVAFAAQSLALLADAGHMLTDVGALGAALWAIHLAARPPSERWTYGLKRAEILSAAGNGITLLVISGIVLVEAVRRLLEHHPSAHGTPILATALVGCAVNVVVAALVARANRQSLNVEGAYQHILTDLIGFAATVVAGIVILATGWTKADAVASLVVVVLMLCAATSLLKDSGHILLEGTPEGVQLNDVRRHLLEVDHVREVHDLHAWTITSGLPTLSAHLVVDDECFSDGHTTRLLDRVQSCLADHFDVEHSTFQFEPASHSEHEQGAHH